MTRRKEESVRKLKMLPSRGAPDAQTTLETLDSRSYQAHRALVRQRILDIIRPKKSDD